MYLFIYFIEKNLMSMSDVSPVNVKTCYIYRNGVLGKCTGIPLQSSYIKPVFLANLIPNDNSTCENQGYA